VIIVVHLYMVCKGICSRYKAKTPTMGGNRYIIGQKRCHRCEIYIIWKGLWCPCCGCILRSGPRSSKNKLVLRREEKKRKEENNKKF
jgi:hypothetical protein